MYFERNLKLHMGLPYSKNKNAQKSSSAVFPNRADVRITYFVSFFPKTTLIRTTFRTFHTFYANASDPFIYRNTFSLIIPIVFVFRIYDHLLFSFFKLHGTKTYHTAKRDKTIGLKQKRS